MNSIVKWMWAAFVATSLVACGGGGGGAGTSPFGTGSGSGTGSGASGGTSTTPASAGVIVAMSSTTVSVAAPVTVTATVRDASGAAVPGQVVTFSSPGGLGTFSPTTALSDANGVATVQLAPVSATASGADQVTASVTVSGTVFSGSQGFTVTPGSGPVGTPSLGIALSSTAVTNITPATVTAVIRDASGGPVVGQVVTFTTPGGLGSVSPASALTDASGNAVTRLSPRTATTTGADRVVATATVNGTTLTVSQGFQVTIANADLILSVSSTQIANTGSGAVTVTVTAIDSNRNTVAGVPVTLTADAGAVLTPAGSATGAAGTLTASLGIGANRANRLITLTATSGAVVRTATIQVIGTAITSTLVPAVVAPSTSATIQYRVLDQAGNGIASQDVQIVAAGLSPSSATGTTGANGDFTFSYTAPSGVGSYPVTANIAGRTDTQTVVVQNTGSVPAATPVGGIAGVSASVSANPSVVSTNLPVSATSRSQIRALFLGAGNVPIPNVRARFDLNGDANSIGGSFSTGSSILYSDANGVVTTSYIPGTRSSPTNGLTVRLCYGLNDTDTNLTNCTSSKLVTLTVTGEPLGVAIGTNGVIIVNSLTYVKQFVVTVADAAGVAKAGVNLTVSLDLPRYRKGGYIFDEGKWKQVQTAVCANEDVNRNGVLDPGEDLNVDGILWPRKPDVLVSLLQSTTGTDGTAVIQIEYAQDHGSWVDTLITVSASGVSGSEGRASYDLSPVPVDAGAIAATPSPAFVVSPYGTSSSCADFH